MNFNDALKLQDKKIKFLSAAEKFASNVPPLGGGPLINPGSSENPELNKFLLELQSKLTNEKTKNGLSIA